MANHPQYERASPPPVTTAPPRKTNPPVSRTTSPSLPTPDKYQKIQYKLSRFHHPETKISIEKKEPLSPRHHLVLITYRLPNGRRTSFQAILDLNEQTLPRRWGRTIHENLDSPPNKIFPDGSF